MRALRSKKTEHEAAESCRVRTSLREARHCDAHNLVSFRPYKVLVPTDLSPTSLKALRYAVRVTETSGSLIWLVYLQQSAPFASGMESMPLVLSDEQTRRRAQRLLHRWLQSEVPRLRQGGAVARVGSPARGIVEAAAGLDVDLIVTTTHGYSGWHRLLHPSIAERVVRWAPCPVLAVSQTLLEQGPQAWERVVVPVDFSSCSQKCVGHAAALPKASDLVLLHVVELYPIDYVFGLKTNPEESTRLGQQALVQLERFRQQIENSPENAVQTLVRFGKPYREIVNVAKAFNAQLVIMGTHGYCGLRHYQFGSTAERVVRLAPCPVLVIRHQDQEFTGPEGAFAPTLSRHETSLSV